MASHSDVLELGPGEGRHYALGRMQAVFKADQGESGERYAISEWWLEPHCTGAGAHLHEANEEIFYVLEGTACRRAAFCAFPPGSCMISKTAAMLRSGC